MKFAKLLLTVLLISLSLNSARALNSPAAKEIKSVTAITEVFGDGQKVTALAVEYDKVIKNASLSKSAFSVEGRTITNVYTNSAATKTSIGVDGKYVIIELSLSDKGISIVAQNGPKISRSEVKVFVKQTADITTTKGEKIRADNNPVMNDKQINLIVDDFLRLEYKDPQTGKILKYNLFVPKNYDKNKTYPMVLFIHDAGVISSQIDVTLIQGIGAVIWAAPSEQAKHECFVLAPQFSAVTVNDNSEAKGNADILVDLISSLVNQYSIDKNRLYTTGQSMGCMMSIAMNIKYPDLFAASFLVAGQWDAEKTSVLYKHKMWIIVSEGDLRAFPGMNAITAAFEKQGGKVSRAAWSGLSTPAEFASEASKMIAEGNNVKYTVLKKGTVVPAGMKDDGGSNHVCTWRIAYTIEGVRDWLFTQKKVTSTILNLIKQKRLEIVRL